MDVLTAEEIAAMLRIDAATVRRWCRAGALPAIRVGRQWRVERAAFEAFIRQQEKPQPPQNRTSLALAR